MDSYERLIEDLPARLPPGRTQRASEKAIRETVAALPLANPAQGAREVEQILDGMLATTWAGAERLAALEHLRAPVTSLCEGIERQLAAEPHPLPAAATEWATTAQRMQGKLACAYALGLHELCAPAGKVPMFKGKLTAGAAVRGLVHSDHALVWAYRQYQSPPTGAWRRVHALHAFASEAGLADQAVDDALASGTAQTARTAYAQLLLLAMSNPYRFSARELQEARQVIRCVAGLCGIARTGTRGIGVDTDSDAGPGYVAADRVDAGSGVLALDVEPVERVFDERSALLPPGVDAIDLPQPGARALTTSVRFLARLRAGWGTAPRGHARLTARHALDVVVGMHALHYALAGNLDFSNFVRQVHGDAIMVGTHELASAWLASSDTTQPQRFRAEVLDQSEGGYRLRLAGADGLRMRMGEVIGLAPTDEDEERDWMVGVIRWLRHDGDAELLGVELLRREARAAGLRPVTAQGETLAPLRAVELLNGREANTLSLLVTNRLARNIVAAEVVLPARATDWGSRASVSNWRMGETEALGPACFCVTLERDPSSETS
ncbi:MAG: hypothetical protein OJF55_000143 [Rhodanobacteraceae bacterium]|jgi:hypothetical protein|nr:MAG: hypothetical protein OJF55_000143 [Rhodanobacteraceae bacterium]